MVLDASQQRLVDRLAQLGAGLSARGGARSLYIHGPSGRGKSWIADAFFDVVSVPKTRVHFHGFFEELHRRIREHRGDRDAVERAVEDVTARSRLLLFDELHVHDSGDARLLTRLLAAVFRRQVTVLATSNYAPDDLLPDPIWHHTFEPGIRLIKRHMDLHRLGGPIDYRTLRRVRGRGFAAGAWTAGMPHGAPRPADATNLEVRGRSFEVLAAGDGELWASFAQLCEAPTSTIEYLEWARTYDRWIITDIPSFGEVDESAQQRFVNIVDILVDADVRATFVSGHDLRTFLASVSGRHDAFRMASRLRLLA